MGIYFNKGRKRWIAHVALHGRRVSKACDTHAAARIEEMKLLQDLQRQAGEGVDGDSAAPSVHMVCDTYLEGLARRGKAHESVIRASDTVKRLTEFLGPRMQAPFVEITTDDLYGFRTARTQGGAKPSTINRDFRTLRAIWKRAAPDFRFPRDLFVREDETRVRWLEPAQLAAVTARLPSPFAEMAWLAALTLMRITEVRTLRREQIALAQGILVLPRTKTGPATVVLSAPAAEILRVQLDVHHSEWVFPSPVDRPYSRVHVERVWRKAARATGLFDFTFHDLRHHGATMALNAGFSSAIVMELGRWKSERMMRRYAAITDKTLRAAAEAVAQVPKATGRKRRPRRRKRRQR